MDDVEIGFCAPEYARLWAEFLDRNFGYEAPQSYAIDFAPLFELSTLGRARLAFCEGAIVASATYFPVKVIASGKTLALAIVGAVATDEKFRGKGFSRRVLDELEKGARAEGAEGLILWSDQKAFYAKTGFIEAGRQQIFSLDDLPERQQRIGGSSVQEWDWTQVRALYERHPMRVERSAEHWRALSKITSVHRAQWVGEDGKVRAYIAYDRGHDLQGIVHEWGGAADALYSLVWEAHQKRPGLHWLTHPRMPDPISPSLGEPTVDGGLALFKPLVEGFPFEALEHVWFWGLDSL